MTLSAAAGPGRAGGRRSPIYVIHWLFGSTAPPPRPGAVLVGRSAANVERAAVDGTGRRSRLLLLLQLLAAALAALALARPAMPASRRATWR